MGCFGVLRALVVLVAFLVMVFVVVMWASVFTMGQEPPSIPFTKPQFNP